MMNATRVFLVVLTILVLLLPHALRADLNIPTDSPLIPAGLTLERGDSFHLVFVTSTRINMTDLPKANPPTRTIADFNNYVNSVTTNSTLDGISNVTWFVIGSTSDVDAKDNAIVSAPVYRLGDGAKVADDAADMWDGSIDNRITYDESGTDLSGTGNWQVWSGTATNGTEYANNRGMDLATTRYAAGWGNFNPTDGVDDPNWIDLTQIATDDRRVYHFYALSEKITVAPPSGCVVSVR